MNWKPTMEDKINALMVEFALDFKLAQKNYRRLDFKDQCYILNKLELDEYISVLKIDQLFIHVVENELERKFIDNVRYLFNKRREEGAFIMKVEISEEGYNALSDDMKISYVPQYQEYISHQPGSDRWVNISEIKRNYTNNETRKVYRLKRKL